MVELQEKLEKEGYRFLTNISLTSGYEIDPERDENGYYNYKKLAYKIREIPFTDSELVEKVRDLERITRCAGSIDGNLMKKLENLDIARFINKLTKVNIHEQAMATRVYRR